MVKLMRYYSLAAILILAGLPSLAAGSGRATYRSQVYFNIAADLTEYYLPTGKPLPTDFAEMPCLQEAVKLGDKNSMMIKDIINELALVPGAPLIDMDFSSNYDEVKPGSRLFAISRFSNRDYNKESESPESLEGGRYVIFIKRDGKSAWSIWMKEKFAGKVLDSIPQFKADKQPVTYANLEQDRKRLKIAEDDFQKKRAEEIVGLGKESHFNNNKIGNTTAKLKEDRFPIIYLIAFLAICGVLLWMFSKKN